MLILVMQLMFAITELYVFCSEEVAIVNKREYTEV
jgi:hypothetical protein